MLQQGTKVKIDPRYGIGNPDHFEGIIDDHRAVGMQEHTESYEYLVRCLDSKAFWVNERYLDPYKKYFVWFRDKSGFEREVVFNICDDWNHAAEQAEPYRSSDEFIVRIELEF